jgi:hypothetical protein
MHRALIDKDLNTLTQNVNQWTYGADSVGGFHLTARMVSGITAFIGVYIHLNSVDWGL